VAALPPPRIVLCSAVMTAEATEDRALVHPRPSSTRRTIEGAQKIQNAVRYASTDRHWG